MGSSSWRSRRGGNSSPGVSMGDRWVEASSRCVRGRARRRRRGSANGQLAPLGRSVDPARQRVTLDGRAVRPGPVTWLALNKPVGYVVSRKDPEGRRTVFELVPKVPGLTYVGRLDVMTSGLLLLTTDGAAAHRLMHPRFAVPRTYWLRAHGRGVAEVTSALGSPIALDGRPVRVTAFRVRPVARSIELEVTLAEGRGTANRGCI